MPRYKVFFRETVIKRCHVTIDSADDPSDAIVLARAQYGQKPPEEWHDCDAESGDIEIFAVDEFTPATDAAAARSWELDGVSGMIGFPINIETER